MSCVPSEPQMAFRGRGDVPREQKSVYTLRESTSDQHAYGNCGMTLGMWTQPASQNHPIVNYNRPVERVESFDPMHAERMQRQNMKNVREMENIRGATICESSRFDGAGAMPKAGLSSRDLSRYEINKRYEEVKNIGINKASYGTYGMY